MAETEAPTPGERRGDNYTLMPTSGRPIHRLYALITRHLLYRVRRRARTRWPLIPTIFSTLDFHLPQPLSHVRGASHRWAIPYFAVHRQPQLLICAPTDTTRETDKYRLENA